MCLATTAWIVSKREYKKPRQTFLSTKPWFLISFSLLESSTLLVTIIPPSPQTLRFFNGWKLKQPNSPKPPHLSPLYSACNAWQASSTIGIEYSWEICLNSSILLGLPDQWIGIMLLF